MSAIKETVAKQCKWILNNYDHTMFDADEFAFLTGSDRSTDASAQLDYLGHLICRHYLVLSREVAGYPDMDIGGLTMDQLVSAAQDSFYLQVRLRGMANYGREAKKMPKLAQQHWVNDDGRSMLISKLDMFEWIVREQLSPQNINKIINGTRNVERGWRLVRA